MRRREFLLGTGLLGTLGSAGVAATLTGDIDIRWWATERAARYPDLHDRVGGYLRACFGALSSSVSVTYGGTVSFYTENAYELVVDGVWPRYLVSGTASGQVTPVDDVNLLVTDSSMRLAPTGAGVPYVAAVGGARQIARAPPAESVGAVVPDTLPLRTVQILLHECGHALGLQHDHGTVRLAETEPGTAAVVSPMVSGYAWATGLDERRHFTFETNRCGHPYPSVAGRLPRLRLRFDECERRGISRFRLPSFPTAPVSELSVDGLLSDRPTCGTCALAAGGQEY